MATGDSRTVTGVEMPVGRILARWFGSLVLGLVVGVVGTGVHRYRVPWGLVLAIATVLVGGILSRAWVGGAGTFCFGMGVVTATGILAATGPGGDALIVAEPVGYVWYGAVVVLVLAWAAPARWFEDRPRGDVAEP